MKDSFKRLTHLAKEIQNIGHVLELLHWDQEVFLPSSGVEQRAEQIALVSQIFHQKISHPELSDLLENCGCTAENSGGKVEPGSRDHALLRYLFQEHDRSTRLSEDLVMAIARETALASSSWKEARKQKDATPFLKNLTILVELTREKMEQYGYKELPYDALLFDYEPELLTREVASVFDRLQPKLIELLGKITSSAPPRDEFARYKVDVVSQQGFHHLLLNKLGFPRGTRGRFDTSVHPFTTTLGGNDVRITTRYDNYLEGIFGTIHEFGHALYELQVDEQLRGSFLGEATSLTIHESQSRLWENFIGRSYSFWEFWYPQLQKSLPGTLDGVDLSTFWKGINKISPSLIRVSADELTYNLHIILRFRLEQQVLNNDFSVAELPAAWREESKRLLGVEPADDAEGMLQDVHWSHGLFGYFPTYALGNLCAAQFYATITEDLSGLEDDLKKGSYEALREWLQTHIHQYGRVKTGKQLLREITGAPLGVQSIITYLTDKYQKIYNF